MMKEVRATHCLSPVVYCPENYILSMIDDYMPKEILPLAPSSHRVVKIYNCLTLKEAFCTLALHTSSHSFTLKTDNE